MGFLSAAWTDVGTTRKVNQDAYSMKIASFGNHTIAFAAVCDGMGGMANGEIASAFVVNAFSAWFKGTFSAICEKELSLDRVQKSWTSLIQEQNKKIFEYGTKNGSMGTTLSAVLIVDNWFLTAQVGDSRIYKLSATLQQETKDQSFVAREVEQGRMTPAEAKVHPRSNELLQAIGTAEKVKPVFTNGNLASGEAMLVCSDGFYHEISADELYGVLAPVVLTDEHEMEYCLKGVTELLKDRGETDNISAILIKKIG